MAGAMGWRLGGRRSTDGKNRAFIIKEQGSRDMVQGSGDMFQGRGGGNTALVDFVMWRAKIRGSEILS